MIFTIEWFGTNDPGSYAREGLEGDERNRNLASLSRAPLTRMENYRVEEQLERELVNNGQS